MQPVLRHSTNVLYPASLTSVSVSSLRTSVDMCLPHRWLWYIYTHRLPHLSGTHIASVRIHPLMLPACLAEEHQHYSTYLFPIFKKQRHCDSLQDTSGMVSDPPLPIYPVQSGAVPALVHMDRLNNRRCHSVH